MSKSASFRDLLVLNYFPGKRVVGLGAKFSEPELNLQKILQALTERRLKPLSVVVTSSLPNPGEYFLYMIIEYGEAGEGVVRGLVSELESLRVVSSASIIWPPLPGFVGDDYFDFKGFLGNRAIIVGAPALSGFLKGLHSTFREAGAVFLYHTGKSIGTTAARIYQSTLNIRDVEAMYKAAEIFFHSLGYVRSLTFTRRGREVTATLAENLECILLRDFKLPPTSNWLRGMIEGVVEVFENAGYESEEVECINKGDENCKIILRPLLK
ncbi:MAG: hypothetical protein RMJ28_06815 [Nitrososphaerota archaeon]|nr:hypothetical protein [Candidatus Calditenuaceae archaeon]MDW8073924.1 hypothetical protein [Nitrososphaerota archaeon]